MPNFECNLKVQQTSLRYLIDIVIDIYDNSLQCYTNECIKEIFSELISAFFIAYKNIDDEAMYDYVDEEIINGLYYEKYLDIFSEVLEYTDLERTVIAVVNVHNGKEIEITFKYLANYIEELNTREDLAKFVDNFINCLLNTLNS